MSSVFLGTGAAELAPDPFCGCALCRRLRENRETRLRAAFLLDSRTMIDFGPDVSAASQHYGVPLCDVRDVLITHTHEDHFNDATFSVLTMTDMSAPIAFHLSPEGLAWVERYISLTRDLSGTFGYMLTSLLKAGRITFSAEEAFRPFTVGEKTVTPVKGNHSGFGDGELAYSYLVESKGRPLLYAADTGLFAEETLAFLETFCREKGPLGVIVSEGTYGSRSISHSAGHLSGETLAIQLRTLAERGCVDRASRVFVTHINQTHSFTADEYQAYFDAAELPCPVHIAYDGMRIETEVMA